MVRASLQSGSEGAEQAVLKSISGTTAEQTMSRRDPSRVWKGSIIKGELDQYTDGKSWMEMRLRDPKVKLVVSLTKG